MTTAGLDWLPRGPKLDVVRVGLDPASTPDDFARWQSSFDFEGMDATFAEVLPLFAARFGSDDGRINGFRRRNFYLNTIAFSRINDAVDLLAAASIECVLGGGLAAIRTYPEVSCRSLPDAELIVAAADHPRAQDTLAAAGWTMDELGRMSHPTGALVTLASRLRGTAPGFVTDTGDIESTLTTLTGRSLRVITPVIAVVETAVAAVWPASNPPIRWVVDIDLLLSTLSSRRDVDAIVRHARAHDAAHLVRVALQLARRLGARSVPRRLLRRLAVVHVTAFERDAVMARSNVSRSQFQRERAKAAVMFGGDD